MDKHNASVSLRNASYSPKGLMAIYSGVLVALSVLLMVVNTVLGAIQTSGGLDSMNMKAMLSTAQMALLIIKAVLLPFWAAGLCFVAIGLARGQSVGPKDLTAGFRKILPIIISKLFIGLQYAGRIALSFVLSSVLSSQILMFTPAAGKLYEVAENMENLMELGDYQTLLGDDIWLVMGVCVGVFTVVTLILLGPVFYRYRMTTYLIMDGQERGGLRAMLRSCMLMFRRRWELAKLDLSFWWYYLLLALCSGLCFGDVILLGLGVTLPVSDTVLYWVFIALGFGAQLAVEILAGPKVAVTYAHCYDRFLNTSDAPVVEA